MIILFLLFLCAGFDNYVMAQNDSCLSVEVEEINLWVDLMPGIKESKIYFSGGLKLKDRLKEPGNNLGLCLISILQNSEPIYTLDKNTINCNFRKVPGNLYENVEFDFSTKEGLNINNLKIDDPVKFQFRFIYYKNYYDYTIDSVKIRRVY